MKLRKLQRGSKVQVLIHCSGHPRMIANNNELVGNSYSIREIREQIDDISDYNINVLILGETGVGKELVAKKS